MPTRSLHLRAESVNEESRTVDAVLSTEGRVEMWVPTGMFSSQRIEEVLIADGMRAPEQVPLLEQHSRWSLDEVLGSVRNIRVENGQVVGTLHFAEGDERSERAWNKVRQGHLTDVSVGYKPAEYTDIQAGEKKRVAGKDWAAEKRTLRITTAWDLREASLVSIGADPSAKLREFQEENMTQGLRESLIERGMPNDATDEQATEWMAEHFRGLDEKLQELERQHEAKPAEPPQMDVEKLRQEAIDRAIEIGRMCDAQGIEADQRDKWIREDKSVGDVAREILRNKPTKETLPVGTGRMEFGESEYEKRYAAMRDGIAKRAIRSNAQTALDQARKNGDFDAIARCEQRLQSMQKPSVGAAKFQRMRLPEIARQCLVAAGVRNAGELSEHEAVRKAMRLRDVNDAWLERADTPAYHTTGSFTNLMLDATNKTLLAAYDETPVTWPMWVRQAPSASDFKQLNRIRFGELPDPEVVPENDNYPQATASDSKEAYRVEKYGQLFTISLEAIINDDLNAITRIPQMQGAAMRRKQDKIVYAILTGNPAMSDGNNLFDNSNHSNALTNALATTALDLSFTSMMTQTGLSSETILALMPRYLIVPAALSASALKIVTSQSPPDNTAGSTEDATRPNYNSGTNNIYGPAGARPLMVVVSPYLDASSTSAWYLAADTSQVDTVEMTFLSGEESPVLDREEGFEVDAIKYKIRQTFASKAIDWRGLHRGNT